jgi:tetratricopeptide (TPR) repeat protein
MQPSVRALDAGEVASQLRFLEKADLIRPATSQEDSEYSFKHGLIQEAAYESLLRSARSELHERVAEAIETLADSDVTKRAAVLAEHYDQAGRAAKALHYLVLAAENAGRQYAREEALHFYDRALTLSQELDDPGLADQVQAIYTGRGRLLEVAGDHQAAEANYRAMLAYAEGCCKEAVQADALNRLVTVQIVYGLGPEPDDTRERALALARRVGDPVLIARALWNKGLALRFHEPQRAVERFQEALRQVQRVDSDAAQRVAASLTLDLLVGLAMLGRLREGKEYAYQALEAFRRLDNRQMIADALGGIAFLGHIRGETEETRRSAAEGRRISEEIDNPWGIIYNDWSLLSADLDAGKLEKVLVAAQQRIPETRELGFPVFEGQVIWLAAAASLELGQTSQALALAEESCQALSRVGGPIWPTWGLGVLGAVRVAAGMLEEAGAILEPLWPDEASAAVPMQGLFTAGPAIAAWALATDRLEYGQRFCSWLIDAYEHEEGWRQVGEMRYWRGRLYLAGGDLGAAEADLQRSREILAGAEVLILLWHVDAALAAVYEALGNAEQAAEHRQRAAEGVDSIAQDIEDPELRALFLARTDVQEVLG